MDTSVNSNIYLTPIRGQRDERPEYPVKALGEMLTGNVRRVLLSNFEYEPEWLLGECPVLTNTVVEALHGLRQDLVFVEQLKSFCKEVYKPHLPQYGTHHSKFFIAYYDEYVRIAITTANFIQADWTMKTQATWMMDFPLLSPGKKLSMQGADFLSSFSAYLSTVGGPASAHVSLLSRYDFSAVNCYLIPSAPGYHQYAKLSTFGHLRCRAVLSSVVVRGGPWTAQFSSLGSIDNNWLLKEMATSFMCSSDNPASPTQSNTYQMSDIKLIWPTVDAVRTSIEGYEAGGSLCCNSNNMRPPISELMHRFDGAPSGRARAMPHIKSYLRHKGTQLGYFLLTSANLSKSAWGNVCHVGKDKVTSLKINSYELGVLLVPDAKMHIPTTLKLPELCQVECELRMPDRSLALPSHTVLTINGRKREMRDDGPSRRPPSDDCPVITLTVPICVPYTVPPMPYTQGDVPWTWDVEHLAPDTYGMQYNKPKFT